MQMTCQVRSPGKLHGKVGESQRGEPSGTRRSKQEGPVQWGPNEECVVRSENYPLGWVHCHTRLAFAKKLRRKMCWLIQEMSAERGNKFRHCSRKRSGEKKPLTKRKRRRTAVCIPRQMFQQKGLTERDSRTRLCVGARVEMFFFKLFVFFFFLSGGEQGRLEAGWRRKCLGFKKKWESMTVGRGTALCDQAA